MTEPQNVSGLMDQIHDLKQQLADAEKRGAVKALPEVLERVDAERQSFRDYAARDHGPEPKRHFTSVAYGIGVARGIIADRETALRIESGEVTT